MAPLDAVKYSSYLNAGSLFKSFFNLQYLETTVLCSFQIYYTMSEPKCSDAGLQREVTFSFCCLTPPCFVFRFHTEYSLFVISSIPTILKK